MLRGQPQTLRRVADDDVVSTFGPSWDRGRAYARAGRVTSIITSGGERRATAKVIGSGRAIYHTDIALVAEGRQTWLQCACTCPVAVNCKHAAALLIALRSQKPWITQDPQVGEKAPSSWAEVSRAEVSRAEAIRGEASRAETSWRDALGDYVSSTHETDHDESPVGLVLDVEQPRAASRWQQGPVGPVIHLRPVVPGAIPGRWIKSGISWEAVSGGYYANPRGHFVDGPVLDALTAIADAHRRATRMSHSYGRMSASIRLDQLGRGWIDLLTRALEAGVVLLADSHSGGTVHLAREPGRFAIDLTRQPDGSVRAEPTLDLPGVEFRHHLPDAADVGSGQPTPSTHIVGVPPTGWFRIEPTDPAHGTGATDLRLGGFDDSVDLAAARLLERGPFTIPEGEFTAFALEQLPVLQRRATVRSHGDLDLPEVTPPRLLLKVRFGGDHTAYVQWFYRYGHHRDAIDIPVGGEPHTRAAFRDQGAERALLDRIPGHEAMPVLWDYSPPTWRLRAEATLTGFDTVAFGEIIDALADQPDVELDIVGDQAAYQEVTEAPRIALGTHDQAGAGADGDWFDLSIDVTVGGHAVPLGDLVRALTLGEDRLLLPDGAWFRLEHPELRTLRDLVEEAGALRDKPTDPLRLSVLHAGLWEELLELGVVEEQSDRWQRSVDALLGSNAESAPTPATVPPTLKAVLRPYQADGFRWLSMLWDLGLGGVLADDMGLGKTVQVIAAALRAKDVGALDDPMLIVAPTSVLATWVGEVQKFAPDLRVVVLDRTRAKARKSLTESIAGADLVVTTYAVARLDAAELASVTWSAVVLDEAQFVKNHQAKTYAAIRRLPTRVTFALTGTPLENSLMDLWSLLSIVAPGLYPKPKKFKESWAKPIETGRSPELLPTLRRRIRPLMLRRTKEAVVADLPPKQEQVLEVALHPKHRAIYDRHLARERQRLLGLLDDFDGNRIAILRALTVLRQMSLDPSLVDADSYGGVAPSAKIEALLEQLVELAAEGHRALVFSQFTGFLGLVRERLIAEGLEFAYLDGSTRRRQEVVAGFREGVAPVFLISLKAGGFGLTLTEADYVFVLDPWWNPAAENQAIDRAHRIGQTKSVNVYRLVSTDTIEEKVVALQERKRDLFARVVDDGELLSSALTVDDLRGLLAR